MPLHATAIVPSPRQPSRASTEAARRPRPVLLIVAAGALWLLASMAVAGTEEGVAAFEAGNYEKAFEELKPAAEEGNARAQGYIGEIYLGVPSTEKNYAKAKKWLTKSVDNGYSSAANSLGLIYENGLSVGKNTKQAFNFYKIAAKGGDPSGQFNLGRVYKRGIGTERDYSRAALWFERSAEAGVNSAKVALAELYGDGAGVEKNLSLARSLAHTAAVKGHARGQAVYAILLNASGKQKKAYNWQRKAALQSHPPSIKYVGKAISRGYFSDPQPVLGAAWLAIAAKADAKGATALYRNFRSKLTDSEKKRMYQLVQKIANNPSAMAPKVQDGAGD